jgi:hypothetical protein
LAIGIGSQGMEVPKRKTMTRFSHGRGDKSIKHAIITESTKKTYNF